MIRHINKMKAKNHMIISVVQEKDLTNLTSVMIQTFNKVGIEGMYLNIIKSRFLKKLFLLLKQFFKSKFFVNSSYG